jgi:hypothetical protein
MGVAFPTTFPRNVTNRHRLSRRVAYVASLAALAASSLTATTPDLALAGSSGPPLTVDGTTDVHAISPYIYGMAYASSSVTAALRIPIQRWGGDATTRYNWELDSTNSGADWYFMSGGSGVPSAGPDALEAQAQSIGGTTLMTVPIIPWIAGTAATSCSFPTPPYPAQQSYNPYVTLPNGAKCGNGVSASGTDLTDTDITSNNTANSPAFQEQWVEHLVSKFGDAAHGGVGVYEMDNEPSGWNNTHRDVHPALTGWDELVGNTEEYAAAIKAADPTAQVDGPGDFGFAALVDMGPPGDDRASHGGQIWEAQYYLQQLAAYQQQHGVRLLDYFDEHYYPVTPNGVDDCIALCPEGDANTQAARLESTRSLWDPTYVENDWIGQYYGATDYLGRMQSYVNEYYPGTKLAISEYNFGGLESMNGALAEADVLGTFGQEDVGLASLWSPPSLGEPGAFSFAMYRNYDGEGDGFGDTSVEASSADRDDISVYAATRSSDGALTVMVINKTATDLASPLSVTGFGPASTAQVWTYDASDLSSIVQGPSAPVVGGDISVTYPADSITLLVIPAASSTGSTTTSTTSTSTTAGPTTTTAGPTTTTAAPTTAAPTTATTPGPTTSTSTTAPSTSGATLSSGSTAPSLTSSTTVALATTTTVLPPKTTTPRSITSTSLPDKHKHKNKHGHRGKDHAKGKGKHKGHAHPPVNHHGRRG